MIDPLTPPDCNLRDFSYMPLEVARLRDSEAAVILTGDEFRAAVLLWCAAWYQLPAASLPMDDRLLANLAGYGRDLSAWKMIKAGALRGFVECSDGRLYHPVIAVKAVEAWEKKWDRPDRATERSEHARKAAKARWERKSGNTNAAAQTQPKQNPTNTHPISQHMPEHCSADALKGSEERGREEIDGGGGERAALSLAAEHALLVCPLFYRFTKAYPGPVKDKGSTRQTFIALYDAGHADAVIAATEAYAKQVAPEGAEPVDRWLARSAWKDIAAGDVPKSKAPLISAEAHELAKEVAAIAGFADPLDWPPGWCGSPLRVQMWLSSGWHRDVILTACRASMSAKRYGPPNSINYFEKAIARAIAQQAAPLPEVVINPKPEVIHVEATGHRPTSSYGASRDRSREAVIALKAFAEGDGDGSR